MALRERSLFKNGGGANMEITISHYATTRNRSNRKSAPSVIAHSTDIINGHPQK